jgi:HAD superfamily hydrolase (TIGR01490 family)
MDLALFDLDNTLLGGDSDLEWGEFLMARGALDRATFEPLRRRLSADYHAGRLDVDAFYACQLGVLTRHPRAALEAWREEYLAQRIRPIIGPPARALIRRHQEQGALCAVVTGTSAFTTWPISRELGIPHLVATVPAWDGQRFTGAVRGTAAYGAGKVVRVGEWLESLGYCWESFGQTWFYSDSHNDLPLLEKVGRPVAVDPDPTLRRAAEARGWPILSLR